MVTRRTDVPEDEGQLSREGIGVQQVSWIEAIRIQGSLTEVSLRRGAQRIGVRGDLPKPVLRRCVEQVLNLTFVT